MKISLFPLLTAAMIATCGEPAARQAPVAPALPIRPEGPHALVRFDTTLAGDPDAVEIRWRFNGTDFFAAQRTAYVPVHAGFDTLIAFHERRPDSLVLLCDMKADSVYHLSLNSCCGDFYFSADNAADKEGQLVDFQVFPVKKGKKWLGVFHNTAVPVVPGRKNLLDRDISHSPMHSNRFNLYLTPWVFAKLDTTICTVIDGPDGAELGGFRPPDTFTGIWYTFLHRDSIRLTYDTRRKFYKLVKTGR